MSLTPPSHPVLADRVPEEFSTLWDTLVLDARTLGLPVKSTIRPPPPTNLGAPRQQPADAGPSARSRDSDLEILRTIGEGGMGLVRLAHQRSLRREVAVKTVRPSTRDRDKMHALTQEALVTGALEHPNVIPVYTYAVADDGSPLIVMKRVEGVNWREFLEGRRPLPDGVMALEWHLDVLLQVANALSFAHSRGVLHRDVKPENVMIGEFGEVYLLDWGLAVSVREEHRGLFPLASESNGIAGTPAYMPPEMVSGDGALLGPHTDVYLLGATLHEVITGHVRHDGSTVREVLAAAYESAPFPYAPAIPRELAAICNRATAREPRDRQRSVEAFRSDVTNYLRHRTSVQLSTEAHARLTRLAPLTEAPVTAESDRDIRDLFGECRFGFEQALKTWPENPDALRGVQQATRAMAKHEIRQGNLHAARALLPVLTGDVDDLEAALAELERRVDADREEMKRLREAAHQTDRTLGARGRAIAALVCGAGAGGSLVLIDAAERTELFPITHTSYFVGWGITLMLSIAWIFAIFRRYLFANQINRQIGVGAVTALASILGFRGLVFVAELPLDLAFRLELVLYGLALGMLGVVSNYRVLAAVPICIAGAFVDAFIVGDGLLTIAATIFLAFVAVAWAWAAAAPRREGVAGEG